MPRPFEHHSGVFFLNVRVPRDLVPTMRASKISLPVEGSLVTIGVNDKVFLSLRTKDPVLARTRFVEAYGALVRHWAAVRAGPAPLTHKQIVALAGDAYRERVARFEDDPSFGPDVLMSAALDAQDAFDDWKYGDGFGEISDEDAHFYAAIQRPYGPELLAFETKADVMRDGISLTYGQALESLFGELANAICARRQLVIDATTRKRLLVEIAEVMHLVGGKIVRNMSGDYAKDQNPARFPAFEETKAETALPTVGPGDKTMRTLVDDWRVYHRDKRAASTLRRYSPSLDSFILHIGEKDIRLIVEDDVWTWAEKRRDTDGIAARTINRNDLVAVASVFEFAATRGGGRRLVGNPARGVRLDLPSQIETRDKIFHKHEVRAILLLARGVKGTRYPKAAASRRWASWICAYTGARIQEVCWLSKKDIWLEGDIWVIRFPRTKEARARLVPIHDALIAEGFVEFWRETPDGFLFVGDRPQRASAKRTPAETRASEIACWIQERIQLEQGVSPNHGWRHTFLTIAEGVGISKRHANAIAGHNRKKDASDGYVAYPIDILKREMDKIPPYDC